jgi:peptide/nickel transport system substrate-binding protein
VNRQSRALLTILIVAVVVIPYCWYSGRRPEPPASTSVATLTTIPVRGGAVVASARTEPRSFNRLVAPEIATELFAMLTLGRLVRVNRATQELEPWLAEKWDESPDHRTFTLTLRQDVAWSDGTPFTAADVLFSFAAAYDKSANSPLGAALSVNGQPLNVASPDARTVVVTYPAVFGPGIRLLDNLFIMPRHKLEAALKAGTFAEAWAQNTPPDDLVSIGPFRLTQYQAGQRLVYERNPRFWRKDARGVQLPYLDRLTIEIVPDVDGEIVRLQSGQTDFMQDSIRPSDLETLRPVERQGRLQIHELGVTPNADAFIFNLRPGRWSRDPRGAWLARKEFRQAISHAVDREGFADTVYLGAAVPIHGPITPGNAHWFWPSIPRYEFSRDKAAALLKGLGLTNRDNDEWLEDEQGTDARFTVLVFRGNSVLERSASVLRDELRKVGLALDIVALEANAVRARVLGGEFESAMIQFTATDMDPAISKDFWLSSGGAHFWNPGQAVPATDWERQIDELMAQQTSTADDAERKRTFNEVQRVFAENLPALYFAAPRVYVATSSRLINLQPGLIRPQVTWSADTLAVKDPTGGTQ